MIAPDPTVIALATAALPTLAALLGILINNQRLSDVTKNIETLRGDMNVRFGEVNRRIEDTKEILRAEMFRIEQVLDARLKHVEETLSR